MSLRELAAREIFSAVGIVCAAFTVFNNLEPFLKFCSWLARWAAVWEEMIIAFWSFVAEYVPFRMPEGWELFGTTLLFLLPSFIASHEKRVKFEKVEKSFRDRALEVLRGICDSVVFGIFLAVFFLSFPLRYYKKTGDYPPWPEDNVSIYIMISLFGSILFILSILGYEFSLRLLAKRFLRLALVVFFFICLNIVGLYADDIRHGIHL